MLLFRKLSFWLALLGLVSTALLVRDLHAEFEQAPPPPPVAPPAKPAGRGVGAAGIVEALRENTAVGVPVSGLVSEVPVKVWDRVEAGAPILRLDDRELRAQLVAREAEIPVAAAELKRLQTRLLRVEKLSASGASPDADRDTLRDELEVAKAGLDAARAAVEQTRLLLARLVVRAPTAGTILQVNVRPGEFVAAGATKAPILLGDISQVQVRTDVDEQLAPRIREGASAVGYLKGETRDPLPLRFVRIEPYIVPKTSLTGSSTERVDTRVLQVIYTLPEHPGRPIYVGQQLDVFIAD